MKTEDPWTKKSRARAVTLFARIARFLAQPAGKKYFAVASRLRRTFPPCLFRWRLPFGAWWLPQTGELDRKLVEEGFEKKELHFVETLLRPGMTVLDIGAHHGLYTLLCSKGVGPEGRVIAFEPSPAGVPPPGKTCAHQLLRQCTRPALRGGQRTRHCGSVS